MAKTIPPSKEVKRHARQEALARVDAAERRNRWLLIKALLGFVGLILFALFVSYGTPKTVFLVGVACLAALVITNRDGVRNRRMKGQGK